MRPWNPNMKSTGRPGELNPGSSNRSSQSVCTVCQSSEPPRQVNITPHILLTIHIFTQYNATSWHRTTCLLRPTLYPDSLDARTFALRIADSSTSHALHCRRAVFEPSRMMVHLCGTLCPFISRTAIWLLQLSCAILSLISFLSTDFVSSAFGVWSHKYAI